MYSYSVDLVTRGVFAIVGEIRRYRSDVTRIGIISLKGTRKCNLLVHYGYRQTITEYSISDMVKYFCLRVFRRDVRRT